jgi:hypothetical protein
MAREGWPTEHLVVIEEVDGRLRGLVAVYEALFEVDIGESAEVAIAVPDRGDVPARRRTAPGSRTRWRGDRD